MLLGRIVLPIDTHGRPCPISPLHVAPATDALHDWAEFFAELAALDRATTFTLAPGVQAWVAAERCPALLATFPDAVPVTPLQTPDGVRTDWSSTEARVAIVRGLMECAGPITGEQVAALTGLSASQSSAALEALEGEGAVLRGRFTESATAHPSTVDTVEWCHRRLLARIHRLTVAGLRREIEPVDVATFVRFLLRHHGIQERPTSSGPSRLFEVIGQLQGLDIPAVSWERDLLPRRISGYRSDWLDELCLTGEVGWGRLFPPARDPTKGRPMASMTRVAPISLFLRDDLAWLSRHAAFPDESTLSSPAADLRQALLERGAMFASDVMQESRLLPTQLDDVLGELVSRGFVTSDGFAGLRSLIRSGLENRRPSSRNRAPKVVRRRRSPSGTGRWSVWRSVPDEEVSRESRREVTEEWAWQLLRRWGVVFRDLLDKEPGAPRWWELLQVYRRLEVRGEIRGGRFISGVGGEQFAVAETIHALRRLRSDEPTAELVVISAADPLNLVGVLTSHARVPSRPSNRVAYHNGIPVGHAVAGVVTCSPECPPGLVEELTARLKGEVSRTDQTTAPPGTDTSAPPELDAKPRRRREPRYPSTIPRPMIS